MAYSFINRLQDFANTVATAKGVPLATVDFNYAITNSLADRAGFPQSPSSPRSPVVAPSSLPISVNLPFPAGPPNGPPMPASSPYVDQIFNPLQGGTGTVNPISGGDIANAAAGLCDLLPSMAARMACKAAGGVVTTVLGGSGDNRGSSYNTMPGCPTGYVPDPNMPGQCKRAGATGMVQRMLPGGATGYGWSPTLGIYGAGVEPITVQSMRRACPRGHVLGNDGVCYRKGAVGKTNRAWNPGTKPLLTGGDVAALNKAKRLQKTIGRIARSHGKAKPCKCGIRKGKAVKV